MPFSLQDVRLTTRRSAGGERAIYPRLLRDRAILPQVDVAIRSFEGLLGKERRELDTQALTHFFGDPKLARGLIACLARSYRYRARGFDELVGRTALRRLRRAGLETPRVLRCHLYDRVNDFGHGFLSRHERAERLGEMEAELALKPGELECLLYLDAEEHAILVRVGPQARANDVVADYNLGLLLALLRHAELVELRLTHLDHSARTTLEQLAQVSGLDLEVSAGAGDAQVRLHGRADALGSWTRHGARLARLLVQILVRAGRNARDGQAHLRLRERAGTLRLGADLLELLCGAAAGDGWEEEPGWTPRELAEALAGPRPTGAGARVRHFIQPLARTSGVVVPDLLVSTGGTAALVCAVGSVAQGARLAPVAASAGGGEPLLFVGTDLTLAPLVVAGARTQALTRPDLTAIIRAVTDSEPAQASPRVA